MSTTQSENPAMLAQPLWRTEQIRALEPAVAAELGVDLYGLMERAGWALFETLRVCWPRARRLWIFCGRGNNGGDGYVLARLARDAGYQVTLVALGEPAAGQPVARACGAWLAAGGQISDMAQLRELPDLIVDALLGIGPDKPLHGPVLEWIEFINRQGVPVLAVDLPSGLHGDTGRILGTAVRASATLTFIGLKPGLLTGRAVEYVGELSLAPLGNLDLTKIAAPALWRLDYSRVAGYLRRRRRGAHKGDCGKVLLVGGGPGMPGAIRLAGEAALRAGAGLVKVGCHADNRLAVGIGRPELMFAGDELDDETLAWPSVGVLGPGLGRSSWAEQTWQRALAGDCRWVVDADGLNWLAEKRDLFRKEWILTPHPGEAARLLECSIAQVEADRLASVQALQQRFGGVVVLKGPGSLVFDGVTLWLCEEGNPGMASGGMGDVLSGIIAALWAQGLTASQAARAGVCIHGEAADLAAQEGERGLLASDLLARIRQLVNPVLTGQMT